MTATDCQEKAKIDELIGIPYTKLDCQALMEKILTRAGVKHKNWIGSNDMWRNAVHSAAPISDWDIIPVGAWLFTIKYDGNEPSYYYDGVNASHVGWYCGGGKVIHSTTGGVQWDSIASKRWTHAALCKLLEYDTETESNKDNFDANGVIDKISSAIACLNEVLKALEGFR